MSSGVAVTVFVVGVVAAIMLHEWGHYATARWFGMRADRFFLGFGPTLWSTRRGETEFGVKLLPLGGFVRIKGMSPLDERLRPVPDAVFDPESLAAERRRAAETTGVPLAEQPAIPDSTWQALADALEERGTPRAVRERVLHRVELNLRHDATPTEARLALTEILASEVPPTGRVGDLHHRLLRGDDGRFFHDRPAWQRAIVLASGSAVHLVQAVVLVFVGFLLFGRTTVLPEIASVQAETPAAEVGLEPGDRIVSIAGVETDDFDRIREEIRAHPEEPISLEVDREGRTVAVEVAPMATTDPDTGERIGVLGFVPAIEHGPLPASDALYETFAGPTSVPSTAYQTFASLGRVFGPEGLRSIAAQLSGEADRDLEGALSMVGVARAAGSGTSELGPLFLFYLLAAVNVFVGIFNILPLPPLDGGHLAVLAVERSVNAIRARRGATPDFTVDPRAVAAIAIPVIVFVGTVSLALVWLDVANPIQLAP